MDSIKNPLVWPFPDFISAAVVSKFVISFLLSIVMTEVFARGLFPILFFVPQSIAMKNLGLLYVSDDPYESWQLIGEALQEHDSNERIRVICISGRHLFKEPTMPLPTGGGLSSPLHEKAVDGKLEVIMPISDFKNQTIKNRYATYSEDYKRRNLILTIDKFVEEINQGKEFLKNNGNVLHQHNILCMWRVIIFSKHCIVQNYFPNPEGEHSFMSPTFVFQKIPHSRSKCNKSRSDLKRCFVAQAFSGPVVNN